MAWHTRPGGVSPFPSGTAAQWAAAWFTPIDVTHLNYLKDNLEFLRNPTFYMNYESTPGTVLTATPPVSTVLFGPTAFTYSGGKVYIQASAAILNVATDLPVVILNFSQSGHGSVAANGMLQLVGGYLFIQNNDASARYHQHEIAGILDLSSQFVAGSNLNVSVSILSAFNTAVTSYKNIRVSLREL